jgi:replicative superfamily II helicase
LLGAHLPLATGRPLQQIALVLIDEVHLLHEAGRGASLEAGTVCRIKMLASLPEMAGVRAVAGALGGLQRLSSSSKPCCHPFPQCAWLNPRPPQTPVTTVRFVAVSATIPNIGDIAAWLGAPPGMVRAYGEELRPVKLATFVKVGAAVWGRGRGPAHKGAAAARDLGCCASCLHCVASCCLLPAVRRASRPRRTTSYSSAA